MHTRHTGSRVLELRETFGPHCDTCLTATSPSYPDEGASFPFVRLGLSPILHSPQLLEPVDVQLDLLSHLRGQRLARGAARRR